MKNVYWTLWLVVGMPLAVMAADDPKPEDMAPQDLLKTRLSQVLSILQQKDLDTDQKSQKVEKIVNPMFDFQMMAKLTLGKTHWTGMTPEQRQRFTDLFVKRLKDFYRDKLMSYSNEEVVYKAPISTAKTAQVPTEILSKDSKIAIVYKFGKIGEQWKIYDVEIQGVSLVTSYRAQFDEFIQKQGIEALLKELEKDLPAPPAQGDAAQN